jgi:hypothetical protein
LTPPASSAGKVLALEGTALKRSGTAPRPKVQEPSQPARLSARAWSKTSIGRRSADRPLPRPYRSCRRPPDRGSRTRGARSREPGSRLARPAAAVSTRWTGPERRAARAASPSGRFSSPRLTFFQMTLPHSTRSRSGANRASPPSKRLSASRDSTSGANHYAIAAYMVARRRTQSRAGRRNANRIAPARSARSRFAVRP